MFPRAPRESRASRTSPSPCCGSVPVTLVAGAAHAAAALVIAMPAAGAPCTTWAVCCATDPGCSASPTPGTTASAAASISAPTSPTSPLPERITPGESSPWPSAWWLKTACPTAPPAGNCGATTASSSPSPRCRTGSRRRGKKGRAQVEAGYLDWALADFSGYLAADELYDGPFCVLSAVDARRQRRLRYEVLDHDPTQADILFFLARLRDAIVRRGGFVRGITTDASPLYPVPVALALRAVPHQVCAFHIRKELTQAVLRVLARLRKRLAAAAPPRPRGRPKNTPEAQRLYRRAKALSDLGCPVPDGLAGSGARRAADGSGLPGCGPWQGDEPAAVRGAVESSGEQRVRHYGVSGGIWSGRRKPYLDVARRRLPCPTRPISETRSTIRSSMPCRKG